MINVIYILIPLSIVFFLIFVILFFWAVNNNQFNDFKTPSHYIIIDDKNDTFIVNK